MCCANGMRWRQIDLLEDAAGGIAAVKTPAPSTFAVQCQIEMLSAIFDRFPSTMILFTGTCNGSDPRRPRQEIARSRVSLLASI